MSISSSGSCTWAEQERDEPPRHPAQRLGHRSSRTDVRAGRSARAHRARALPLAGVSVGPLRRHQADVEVGHRLARAARRCGPARAAVPRPPAYGDHRAGRDGRGRPCARINQRPLVTADAGALFAHPDRREAPGARRPGRPPRRSTAETVNGNGTAPNETEIPAIVEVADDLTSQSRHSLVLRGSPPAGKLLIPHERRDVRVVEGARLESVCRGNSTEGSNPSLSASLRQPLASLAASARQAASASVPRRLSRRSPEGAKADARSS